MSRTMTLDEAAAQLKHLVGGLKADDEVVLTEGGQPVARIVGHRVPGAPRVPGNCKGMLTIVSEDGAHLDDFREYMP